jgi:polyisoprenoid-binding protein YceI
MANKTKWVIDPSHSEIGFKVKHLMISNVKGAFTDFNAEVYTNGDDFSNAEISFSMNPASIDTGVADRNNHLKSADFFDVEKFKEITFKDSSLVKEGEDEYMLTGNLTMKGISKPVRFKVDFGGFITDPWGNVKAGFNLEGKINRKDWDLNWNAALEAGGVLVGDEVKINSELEFTKVQAN